MVEICEVEMTPPEAAAAVALATAAAFWSRSLLAKVVSDAGRAESGC